MEMEYFVPPADSPQWFDYWLAERFRWYLELGIPEEKLRLRHHDKSELSHYSQGTADVSSNSRGAGMSWRASPTGATSTCWLTPRPRGSGWTSSIPRPMSATCPT